MGWSVVGRRLADPSGGMGGIGVAGAEARGGERIETQLTSCS
jgi:hypothetical protein